MHKLLKSQMDKARKPDGSLDLDDLLRQVNLSYRQLDQGETELREATDEAKKAAERHLKAVLDTVGEGVILSDHKGRIVDLNRATLDIFGYERDELIGRGLDILMDARRPRGHSRYIKSYHDSGHTFMIGRRREETARRKNGELFPIELSVGDIHEGDTPLFVGIVRDISERKRAEERQRHSEQLFRDFAQSSSDWFWESDAQHRYTGFNGYSPTLSVLLDSGIMGRNRLDLMAQAGLTPEQIADHRTMLEKHQPFRDFIHPALLPDGQRRYISVSGKPVFHEDGTFLGYRGSACDITDEMDARERLNAVEAQLLAAISSISEGFVLYDADDRLVMCNERYVALFPQNLGLAKPGTLFEEILRTGIEQGCYRPTGIEIEHWIERRLESHRHATGTPFLQELSDGRWIRTTEYPTRDGGVVGIHTDITQEVQLDQALLLAKEQAEAANRAKSEFLATMSHEIRTPMNGVIGMTGLLLDTPLSEEQRHFANTVRVSAEALLAIINDILDISKMEAGKIEFEENAFDVPLLIEGVVDILSPRVKARDLDLVCDIAPEASGHYVGDAGRLRQVLLNLAGNAVKFTEQGSVSLHCRLVRHQGEQEVLHFSVTDTGVGIPDSAKGRLFEMFSQADSSTRRRFGGTGLGLAISRRIVELMGGQIGFLSTEGQGSTFWFEVPLSRSRDHVQPSPTTSLAGLRILVVDDIAINRTVFRRQLESFGASIAEAASAAEGLTKVRRAMADGTAYDMVLLDHQLPGMSGLDLAAILRADPEMGTLKLVLATSAHLSDVQQHARRIGLDAVLAKPVQQSRLVDCLTSVAGRKAQAAEDEAEDLAEPAGNAPALRVLVAEDNAINQQVAVGLLARLGHRADVANDGAEAVSLIERYDYDLILMDMQMPLMDGIAATKVIRTLAPPASKLPIIAMTANAMASDRDACLEAGMDDFITKPIDRRRLAMLLGRWAERMGKTTETAPPPPAIEAPAPAPAPEIPLVDQEAWEDLVDALGEESVATLMTSFRRNAPSQIEGIAAALAAGDFDKAKQIAHSLKGASGNLGFLRLEKQLSALESACQKGEATPDQQQRCAETLTRSLESR